MIATGVSLVLLWLDVRNAPEKTGNDTDPIASAAPEESWLKAGDLTAP